MKLEGQHPVIAETRGLYQAAGPGLDGFYHLRRGQCLRMRVSPSSFDRALSLANALFKAAEGGGHSVTTGRDKDGGAGIVVDDQFVRIRIRERSSRVPHVPTDEELKEAARRPWAFIPKYDFVPTGDLTFLVDGEYGQEAKWSEGKRWRHEERTEMVLDGLEEAANTLRLRRLERERRKMEWAALEERRWREVRRIEELERQVSAWRTARDIRSLVREVQDTSTATGVDVVPGGQLDEWITWALQRADHIDPTSEIAHLDA